MGVYWKGVATTKDGCWDGGTGANALRIPLWGCVDKRHEHAKYQAVRVAKLGALHLDSIALSRDRRARAPAARSILKSPKSAARCVYHTKRLRFSARKRPTELWRPLLPRSLALSRALCGG